MCIRDRKTVNEDFVFEQEGFRFIKGFGRFIAEDEHFLEHFIGNITGLSADAGIGGSEARPSELFVKIMDFFTFLITCLLYTSRLQSGNRTGMVHMPHHEVASETVHGGHGAFQINPVSYTHLSQEKPQSMARRQRIKLAAFLPEMLFWSLLFQRLTQVHPGEPLK